MYAVAAFPLVGDYGVKTVGSSSFLTSEYRSPQTLDVAVTTNLIVRTKENAESRNEAFEERHEQGDERLRANRRVHAYEADRA